MQAFRHARHGRAAGPLAKDQYTEEPPGQGPIYFVSRSSFRAHMTRIGRSLVITGDVECSEDRLIQGRVSGHVVVRDAQRTITTSCTVEAQVHGARVLVEGQLKGGITATERIELTTTSRVEGSLSA